MAKSGGGGSRPQLASGLRYGRSMKPSASNLRVGDTLFQPGTARASQRSGTISKVGRTRFNYTASAFGRPLEITNKPISSLSGAYIQRGNTVYPLED